MLGVFRRVVANNVGETGGKIFLRVANSTGGTKGGGERFFAVDIPKGPPVFPEKIPETSIADMATRVAVVAGVPKPPPSDGPDEDMKEALRKLKEKQKKFQKDDGLPVFLKAGLRDRILYNFTMGLAVLGLGMQVYFYYNLG